MSQWFVMYVPQSKEYFLKNLGHLPRTCQVLDWLTNRSRKPSKINGSIPKTHRRITYECRKNLSNSIPRKLWKVCGWSTWISSNQMKIYLQIVEFRLLTSQPGFFQLVYIFRDMKTNRKKLGVASICRWSTRISSNQMKIYILANCGIQILNSLLRSGLDFSNQ